MNLFMLCVLFLPSAMQLYAISDTCRTFLLLPDHEAVQRQSVCEQQFQRKD